MAIKLKRQWQSRVEIPAKEKMKVIFPYVLNVDGQSYLVSTLPGGSRYPVD